mmetsp:Transcript_20559/g.29023  ORF Transcript_20559/g.29023 Transcript_20559/m.29023 type:complete len:105 (-) Transcript_20559:1139-1453(-)
MRKTDDNTILCSVLHHMSIASTVLLVKSESEKGTQCQRAIFLNNDIKDFSGIAHCFAAINKSRFVCPELQIILQCQKESNFVGSVGNNRNRLKSRRVTILNPKG